MRREVLCGTGWDYSPETPWNPATYGRPSHAFGLQPAPIKASALWGPASSRQIQPRRVRRARGRRARAVRRAVRQDRGRQALRRRRAHARLAPARHDLRRGAAGLRHAVSRRLPRRRAVARDARRAAPLLRHRLVGARGRREGGRAGARAHRRAAGHRDAAAEGAGHGLRRPLGPGLQRAAPLPVAQPDRPRLAVAGDAGPHALVDRHRSPRRRTARWCGWPTARSCSSRRCASWPSASACRHGPHRPSTTR